jgi:D-alanyl-D-alanine carboxypeptidase
MKTIFKLSFILTFWMMFGCHEDNVNNIVNGNLINRMEQVFDSVEVDPTIQSAVLRVDVLSKNFSFSKAYGNATPTQRMNETDQFFSASIGKMVTSLLILKLSDEGLIKLDNSISKYLPNSIVNGLNNFNETDYSNSITVRQLLQHQSGLPDFLMDGQPIDGISPFFISLFSDVNKTWTATEIVAFHKQNLQAIGSPGQLFYYSDTNYQLLGLIIENITNKKLHEYAWEKLFKPVGLEHTYFFFHENQRGNSGREPSISFLGDIPLNFPGMSFDWAAGGLITTTADLKLLLSKAIVGNYLSEKSKTEMINWVSSPEGYEYGLGLMRFNFGPGAEDYIIGHLGATNAFAMYCPKHKTYLTGTLNQLYTGKVSMVPLMFSIIGILE